MLAATYFIPTIIDKYFFAMPSVQSEAIDFSLFLHWLKNERENVPS
jgi:hypothetical protein